MKYIGSKEEEDLEFVICGYGRTIIYHDYDAYHDTLSAGKSLTVETAKTIFKFVNNIDEIQNYEFKGIIPSNVLKYKTDEKYIVWQTEEGLKNILYHENLPVKSGMYWVPKMVWKLKGNSLKVFAITKEVKTEKDKLYNAPFFNISPNGSVCMGNAKFEDDGYDYSKIMNKVMSAFWESIFTHTNNDKLLSVNFTDWCNDSKARINSCNKFLIDSNLTVKNIL